MTEPSAISQQTPTRASTDQLTSPLLYLSSTEAGWEGLVAQAFYEPLEYEPMERADLVTPATRDISLVLFTGGTMSMALRYTHGPWQELHLRHEDLILSPDEDTPCEVRWKILSSVPARTFHLHLSKDLLARTGGPTRIRTKLGHLIEERSESKGLQKKDASSGIEDPLEVSLIMAPETSGLALLFPTGHTWIPRTDWF